MWITRKKSAFARESGMRGKLRISEIVRPALLCALLLLLVAPLFAGSIHDLAADGDAAYRNGDYQKAIDAYSRILSSGYSSGPLLYNMGNAQFKAGHLARAILYYERAAKAMPHNKDVRYNLELARSRTVDRIDAPPRLPVWNVLDAVRDFIAPRTLTWAAWSLALLAALLYAASMLLRVPRGVRILRIGSYSVAGLFAVALLLIGLRIAADHGDPGAIVMQDEVEVHSAPDPTSLKVLTLHEGTKVTIVKELSNWREVRLADGRQGWMPANGCEVI